MYTFTKKERLNSKKQIAQLFEQGHSFFSHPFKVYYQFNNAEESEANAAVLFSVGKKQFKLAVDRNRVKRLCREVYCLNKQILYSALREKQVKADIAFVYVGKELPEFKTLELKMQKALKQLALIDLK
ncbi:MAG: ribonuclease P protein component [Bacteroidales bacterium]|nr:ribonuclease P protein component [Bacteroidales bacterium]